jgi:hypothetical protein
VFSRAVNPFSFTWRSESNRSGACSSGVSLTNLNAALNSASLLARTSHRGANPSVSPLGRCFRCEIMAGFLSVLLQWFKRAVKSTLFVLGYQLVPVSGAAAESVDFLAAKKVKDSHYYSQYVGPYPLFSPWLGHADFKRFFDGVEPYTLVPPERCYML